MRRNHGHEFTAEVSKGLGVFQGGAVQLGTQDASVINASERRKLILGISRYP
jgi:hypothetical protein